MTWPAIAYESHPWEPAVGVYLSNRQRRRHGGPYRSAVLPPIADLSPALSNALLGETEQASAEIARFDEHVSRLFGAAEIAPLQSVLLRSESSASSQIENLTVSARQLALAELGTATSGNAGLVSANVHAMTAAVALAGEVTGTTILAMHAALLGPSRPDQAGRWRTQQVWIGGTPYGPHEAAFVPPHHDQLPAAVADLVRFVDRDDLPILVQAALAHAQFETIHPFTDGNGRTGRALLHAILQGKRLTRRATVPISAGLLTDTEAYFAALDDYRLGGIEPIVQRVTDAAYLAVGNGRALVDELARIRERWGEALPARRGASAWRLRDLVIGQPAVTVAYAADRLGVSATAAQTAVDTLVAAGVLTPINAQRRHRVWQAPEVLEALDAFAARAGRRTVS